MPQHMTAEARAFSRGLPPKGAGLDVKRPLWVHFERPIPENLEAVFAENFGIALVEEHRIDAHSAVHLPFYDAADRYEILIVSEPSPGFRDKLDPGQDPFASSLWMLLQDDLLVTIADRQSRAIPAAEASYARARTKPLRRPLEVLAMELVGHATDGFLSLRDGFSQRIDAWERSILSQEPEAAQWSSILDSQELFRRIETVAEMQEEALIAWREARSEAELLEEISVRLADRIDHARRLARFAERMSNRIDALFPLKLAVSAQRSGVVMQRLTVVAAIFLPLTLIAGLFGMNVGGIPLAANPHAFAIIVCAMALSATLLILYFRSRKML